MTVNGIKFTLCVGAGALAIGVGASIMAVETSSWWWYALSLPAWLIYLVASWLIGRE